MPPRRRARLCAVCLKILVTHGVCGCTGYISKCTFGKWRHNKLGRCKLISFDSSNLDSIRATIRAGNVFFFAFFFLNVAFQLTRLHRSSLRYAKANSNNVTLLPPVTSVEVAANDPLHLPRQAVWALHAGPRMWLLLQREWLSAAGGLLCASQ